MRASILAGPAVLALALGLGGLAYPASSPAQDGTGIPYGPVTVFPSISATLQYDDNLFSQPSGEKDAWLALVAPGVRVEWSEGDRTLRAGYGGEVGRYDTSSADDFENHRVFVGADLRFSPRSKLSVDGEIAYSTESRGSGTTAGPLVAGIAEPNELRTRSADGLYTLGLPGARMRVELGAGYQKRDYLNNRATNVGRDRTDTDLGATVYYEAAPNTDVFFEAGLTNVDYDTDTALPGGRLDSMGTRYLAGVTWEATYNTTGRFGIGLKNKEFDNPARGDESGLAWSLSATWRPYSYMSFDLATSRSDGESETVGDFVETTSYLIGWNHSWLERLTTRVDVGFSNSDYSGDPREDDQIDIGARVDYRFRRWLSLGAGYRRSDRDSNDPLFDYDRNQFFLSINAAL